MLEFGRNFLMYLLSVHSMGERAKRMSIRRGIAAILFRRSSRGFEFLIMHRILRWRGWEALKGGRNPGERPRRALARELKEELGISLTQARVLGTLPDSRIAFRIPCQFREQMGGFSHALYEPFYLVELSPSAKPNLRGDKLREHDRYVSVPFGKALGMLTYGNTRAALRKAAKALTKRRR
jgi:8-oxo-dGTP pyrophosphatase MutT (NUDIX family)